MDKRFIFLHDFKFHIDTFKHVYLQVVRQAIEESKYASQSDELIEKLKDLTKPLFDKFPETKIPLISIALRNAYNYCQTLDRHPTVASVVNVLFPELVECLEICLDSYIISKESEYEYNFYCANAINYRIKRYQGRLDNIISVYDKVN